MRLLETWTIQHGNRERRIELLHGDLSRIPQEHAVDLLVISAFPNDYTATRGSLIGALDRAGISVYRLASAKQLDMRDEFSCWLSQPVAGASFRQLLCIESGWRGLPPEITDDLFRAVAPLFVSGQQNSSLAMPIIGTGDQGWPLDQMLRSVLQNAVAWLRRGLALDTLKIVVYADGDVDVARQTFIDTRAEQPIPAAAITRSTQFGAPAPIRPYDVFVSYCHEDAAPARTMVDLLQGALPHARIFHDARVLRPGQSWLMEIAESLDEAKRVVALYTPQYWASKYCKDEFAAALTRQMDTGSEVLFPVYFRDAKIPYLFRGVQFFDCRQEDSARLRDACDALCQEL